MMRARRLWRFAPLLAVGLLLFAADRPARAGGPIIVGGTFGPDGVPFTWDTSSAIQYNTDGGPLGLLTNSQANARVVAMFDDFWENVSTATIAYNRAGSLSLPNFDGNIDTLAEFDRFDCAFGPPVSSDVSEGIPQNPIIYDEDGSLFLALNLSSSVVGFAGPCQLNSVGQILNGWAVMNGKFIDGDSTNGELTDDEFDAAFIHEFGHFSGLDHSQINLNCLTGSCSAAEEAGVPTMFPILIGGFMKSLALDDEMWISRLYPAAGFNTTDSGELTGLIVFSDGQTHAQGVNVIARQASNPDADAVSVVSGFLFTGNPGQSLTGTNTGGSSFGSRDPLLIGEYAMSLPPGDYTVEVESVFFDFTGGSSVGPLDPPIPNPGADEFYNGAGETSTDDVSLSVNVTVTAGTTTANIDVILNGTPPRFDSFESSDVARLWWDLLPPWMRRELPATFEVSG